MTIKIYDFILALKNKNIFTKNKIFYFKIVTVFMNQKGKISSDMGATSLLPPHKADVAKCVGVVAILQSSFKCLKYKYKYKYKTNTDTNTSPPKHVAKCEGLFTINKFSLI